MPVDHIEPKITERMRNRIQEILVADGVPDPHAMMEANSLCDGLGYYHRVTASTGMKLHLGYDGVEVFGLAGDLLETVPFDRVEGVF